MSGTGGISARTLNDQTDRSVSARGFWHEQHIPLYNCRSDADPPVSMTGATTPLLSNASNVLVIRWGTTTTTAISFEAYLPRNVALWQPQPVGTIIATTASTTITKPTVAMKLRLLMRSAVASVAVGGSGLTLYARNQYTDPLGNAITGSNKGPFSARAAATLATNPTNPSWIELDYTNVLDTNKDRLEPGDKLKFSLALDAHANSGAVDLYGIVMSFRCNHAFTRIAER